MDIEAVAAIRREDIAEWEKLVAVLEAHPEESLHNPGSPPWTSRDVYTHLARWMEHSTASLEARLAGLTTPPIEGDFNVINARWQREDSELSLAEAREKARLAFEWRESVIKSVPNERWDEELEKLARWDGGAHFAEHRSYIVVA